MRFEREQFRNSPSDWKRAEEINQAFDELSATRIERLELDDSLSKSKLAWKFAIIRHALSYRLVDLGEASISAWSNGDHLAAVVLARAFFETAALLHSICYRTTRTLDAGALDELDDIVMNESFGTKRLDWIKESGFRSTNVLTALDHMSKEVEFARDFYENMSEISHPNSFGAHQFYSILDKENITVTFCRNKRTSEEIFSTLNVSLGFASWCIVKIEDLDKLIGKIAEFQHRHQPRCGPR
jgi:hypothetical protein